MSELQITRNQLLAARAEGQQTDTLSPAGSGESTPVRARRKRSSKFEAKRKLHDTGTSPPTVRAAHGV